MNLSYGILPVHPACILSRIGANESDG